MATKKAPKAKTAKKSAPKSNWKAGAVNTKAALVKELHSSLGGNLSAKATNQLVDNLFEILVQSIKKNKRFAVPGFGTFNVRNRKARTGRNPQTGAQIKIKASKTVAFKPTPKVKDTL
ncbi:MAG: HU family DNA-binding protein [Myxococcales bacterium]|nr:MAG: HU family DNA-binding protein [Myxococcales bacterium]